MKGKIHFGTRRSGVLRVTLCGHSLKPERVTTDESAVQCSDCVKLLRTLSVRDVEPEAVAVLDPNAPFEVVPYLTGTPQPRVHAMVLRDDMPERAEWPTWRAAVRAYVTQLDDGWSVRSSSDPGRFEALPGASDGPPQGDTAQRQAARLAIVGWALRRAFTLPFVVQHTPRFELDADTCLAILIAVVSGKATLANTSHLGTVRKKSWYVARSPNEASPESIAEYVATHTGAPVTKRHVGMVVRIGGRAIEPELDRRGLVAVRDEGLIERGLVLREEQGMSGKIVRGWQDIADHVNLSASTVRKAVAWTPPLPIRYVGKHVEAEAEALDAWRKSGPRQTWTPEED